jgi:hypothetical protein
MKNFFSLLIALFVAAPIFAQTDYSSAHKLLRDYREACSNPAFLKSVQPNGARMQFTHKLDSVVTKNASEVVTSRTEMVYNALGHTTHMRQYGIDSLTATLVLEALYTFDYQIPGYASHILFEGLDPETQEFGPQLEMDIFYDGSNRMDSIVISIEDPLFGGGFGPYLAIKQVYNGDLLVQSRQWINIVLFGGWLPAAITDYQYDGNDRLIDELTSSVDFSSGQLDPSDRATYSYNAQGLVETETQYVWEDPTWVPTLQFASTYYSNGTLHNEFASMYENGGWVNNAWTTFPVEDVDDEYPATSYTWDPVNARWNESDSTINLLNPALPWEQVAAPTQFAILNILGGESDITFSDGSSILETQYFLYDTLTQDFYFDSRDVYHYSLLEGSAVSTVLPDYLSVTPNPARDQFTIDLDADSKGNYRIFNVAGVALQGGEMNEGRNIIQTAGWLPGIYYVRIQMADGKVFVHKQMVE